VPPPPFPDPAHLERIAVPAPPLDRAAVRAWARSLGIEALLDGALPAYLNRPYDFTERDRPRNLDELLAVRVKRPNHLLASAGVRYLVRAAQLERYRREVAAWIEAHGRSPSSPALAALLERLRAARRALGPAKADPPWPVLVERIGAFEDPSRLVVRERELWTDVVRDVAIPIDDGLVAFACSTCAEDAPACAPHRARAIDRAIALLLEPPREEHDLLETLAESSPWRRLARALDRATAVVARAPAEEAAPEERLLWRVSLLGDEVSVDVATQKPKRGGWGKPQRVPFLRVSLVSPVFRNAIDAEPLHRWLRAREGRAGRIDQAAEVDVVRALAGHPRVVVATDAGDVPATVVIARLRVSLEATDAGLVPRVALGTAPLAPEVIAALAREPEVRISSWQPAPRLDADAVAFDEATSRLYVARVDPLARAVVRALASHPEALPPESHDEIVRRLAAHAESFELDLPAALDGGRIAPSTRPVLRLTPLEGATLDVEIAVRPLAGGPIWAPGDGPAIVRRVESGRRTFAERDLEAEVRAVEEVVRGLPLHEADAAGPWRFRILSEDRALDLVAALREAGDAVEVEWPADRRLHVTQTSSRLRVEVRDARDWFGVAGSTEVDGEAVALAALLGAVRAGRRYIAVSGGRFAKIERSLRERIEALEPLVFEGRRGLEISPLAAAEVEALVEAPEDLDAAASFREIVRRAGAARALDPKVPRGLSAKLRPYQVEGFRWLARLAAWGAGAVLADDMGLGKTLEALALLLHRGKEGPALVVAPTSVVPNWEGEAARFAPSLRVRVHRGPDRAGALAKLGPKDVLVTSYAIATIDAELLRAVRFATLVVDEAQAIKNAETRRARAIRDLDAAVRVALTGTPVENHLGELWSLMRVVTPGLLGSFEQFRDRFAAPIERMKSASKRAALARVVRPFVLRRTKAEVAPELPPRTEVTRFVEPSHAERALYEAARLAAVKSVSAPEGEDARFLVLAWLTKLRRLACHPRLFDERSSVPSSKLAALLDLVDELREGGHKALVFSQFTSHLALVREALDARGVRYESLEGSTPAAERPKRIEAFQAGEATLFLISLKAGGTGLNLTAADYVIHLDPWWNPAVEDQATDRAHRIGQTRAVTVIRLVARGTIEEQVLALHADKRLLAGAVFDPESDAPAKLSTDELAALLGASARVEDDEEEDAGG
jgi:superfamily II DNA or RNA helicase